jgi:hypothetical protein
MGGGGFVGKALFVASRPHAWQVVMPCAAPSRRFRWRRMAGRHRRLEYRSSLTLETMQVITQCIHIGLHALQPVSLNDNRHVADATRIASPSFVTET